MKNIKKRDKLNKFQIEVHTEDKQLPKGFIKFEENWYYKDFVGTTDIDRDIEFIKSNILSKFQNIINYKIELI
jgi:hypothetical protein